MEEQPENDLAHETEQDLDLASISDEVLPEGHKSGFVAVVGRPNVGKSTLMNAFMQQKIAIVTPKPQTTRTRQLGIITAPAFQMIFIDTPGLTRPRHKLDQFMMATAEEAFVDADVILWLVDGSMPPGRDDKDIARRLRPLADQVPIILAINKSDLLDPDQVMPRTDAYRNLFPEADNWILFSATQGNGRDALFQMLIDTLPEGPRYYPVDQITDLFVRDIAAELIREQILLQIREEIPHGVAVQIEEFKERENGVIYIDATIYVERESHKKIVIGAGGHQLRDIGAAARKEIQNLVDAPAYLDLWVKVEPKWRRDERTLRRFGYAQG